MCSEAVAGSEEGEGLPAGFSVFDALRDTIYSEVATLIANNENRPHFLVSEKYLSHLRLRLVSQHRQMLLIVGGAVSGAADAEH